MQYRPVVPIQQGQQFIQSASQQFQPVGQGIPSSNVGMPASQSQQLQFSQPMQPYPLRPSQPGHATPSSQALPMQYMQTRPITSAPSQSQQPALPFNNQMPGLAGGGMPYSSSYIVSSHDVISVYVFVFRDFIEQIFSYTYMHPNCFSSHHLHMPSHKIMSVLRPSFSQSLKCKHMYLSQDSLGCPLVIRVQQFLHRYRSPVNNLQALLSQIL